MILPSTNLGFTGRFNRAEIEAGLGRALRLLLLGRFGHVEHLRQVLPISFEVHDKATKSTDLVKVSKEY